MQVKYKNIIKNRDYLILLLGQSISVLGSGINYIGLTLYVLRFENSLFGIGTLMMLFSIPWILLSPFAGVIADRYSKKWIMVLCDILRGVLNIALFYTQSIGMFYLIVLASASLGVIFSPAASGFLPFIVEKDDLAEANSVYAASREIAHLIGPAIGGVLIAIIGVEGIFFINGLSFIISGISEIFIAKDGICDSKEDGQGEIEEKKAINEIKEGAAYAKSHKTVGFVIIFFAVATIAYGGLPILYLDFIQNTLRVSEEVYGLFISITGVGAFIGALMVPRIIKKIPTIKVMIGANLIYGALFVIFSIYQWVPYNLAIFFLAGMAIGPVNVTYGIYLQTEVEKNFIGRVFSLDMCLSNLTSLGITILITLFGHNFSTQSLMIGLGLLLVVTSIIGVQHLTLKEKKGEIAQTN